MEEFDSLVIGSGLEVANAAASRGQSVAVVEKGPLGGTCLNRGCNPSKMLLYHADGRSSRTRGQGTLAPGRHAVDLRRRDATTF